MLLGPMGTKCAECASIEPHNVHLEDLKIANCGKCNKGIKGSSCCPPHKLCGRCADEYNSCPKCGKHHPSPAKSARK